MAGVGAVGAVRDVARPRTAGIAAHRGEEVGRWSWQVTRQQYARQRERIEGKLDPDEQSPPPSSMNGEGREGHAGFKGFAIMAHRRLVSAVGGLAATDNMYRRITEQAKDLLRMIAAQAANAP